VDIKNHAPLAQIDFIDWEIRFHKLMLLYNGLIERFNQSYTGYIEQQKDKEFGLEVRITKKDGNSKSSFVKYVDANRHDWMWYVVWKKHYKDKK
jgi:hypothetical protein